MPFLSVPVAAAQPQGAHITGIEHVNDRWDKVSVFSPSMDKVIVNDVFKAPKSGAPVFYLLPGIDGGDNLDPGGNWAPGTKSWFGMTDIQGFATMSTTPTAATPSAGWRAPAAPRSTTPFRRQDSTELLGPTVACRPLTHSRFR